MTSARECVALNVLIGYLMTAGMGKQKRHKEPIPNAGIVVSQGEIRERKCDNLSVRRRTARHEILQKNRTAVDKRGDFRRVSETRNVALMSADV